MPNGQKKKQPSIAKPSEVWYGIVMSSKVHRSEVWLCPALRRQAQYCIVKKNKKFMKEKKQNGEK